ncbi:MAG: hypothetical protein NTV09_13775, partial [Bacteroidetes bacterium]|nr:hypothetical protein [Bacteroidota bacterium]
SPNPDKVIIGSDGWLYLTERCFPLIMGTNLFTDEQLQKIKMKFDERALHLKNKFNSRLYFAIAPLKHTIYPEYLPASARISKSETRTDQLVRLFSNDTMVNLIDVMAALKEKKSNHILYYKIDNHWNDIGGFIAYSKIITEIGKKNSSVHPVDINTFEMDSSIQLIGGEAAMMNASNIYPDYHRYEYNPGPTCKAKEGTKRGYRSPEGFPYPWDYEMVRQTGDSSLPDALIIRDSFTDALLPFLAENFHRSVFIFDAWQYKSLYDIVDTEKPGIVIYIKYNCP